MTDFVFVVFDFLLIVMALMIWYVGVVFLIHLFKKRPFFNKKKLDNRVYRQWHKRLK